MALSVDDLPAPPAVTLDSLPEPPVTRLINPATDFGGDTLKIGPIDTRIPISQAVQNYLAGAGKATVDLGRGLGQLVGLESRKDVAEARRRDAALTSTTAGRAGNISGTVADILPAAFIPGANTILGATAIGAGTGLAQPSTSTRETLLNTGIGALSGPAGIFAGRAVGALAKGAHAAIEPFLPGGAQRIAANTLRAFAGGPTQATAAAGELSSAPAVLPGVQPTMGELTSNAGLAQLQRSLVNNPETLTALASRDQANRAAMTTAIDRMGGTDAQLTAAEGARDAAAKPLYKAAANATVTADDDLRGLLSRPSMKAAWARAQQLASERGDTLVSGRDVPEATVKSAVLGADGEPFTTLKPAENATYSGRAIQYLKMALQDTASGGPQMGMGAHELGAVKSTLSDLQNWITKNVPELRAADQAFAKGSAPINQMQIARQLSGKLQPALSDFGAVPRLNAESYARAVRNGDEIAQDVTGRSSATLAATLTPKQNTLVQQIGEQLARRANAADLGRAAGSNTAQNLAGQNVLRQLLGPFGLPQSTLGRAAQSVLGQTIARPYGFISKAAEPDIQQFLAQAALDPKLAAKMLSAPTKKAAIGLWKRQALLGPLASSAGLLGGQSSVQALQ